MAPLRGRGEQLAAAESMVAGLGMGRGSVLVIEGPPGIGKTRLLDEVALRARRAGVQTLVGRAFEDQQTVPFGPLLHAVVRADPPIGDLAVLKNLGASSDLGFWVIHELQQVLLAAVDQRPLMITVDDVHWADAGTLMALQDLIAGLSRHPVMWVLAGRPAEGRAAVRDALDAVVSSPGVMSRRLRLRALEQTAVTEIAGDVLCANVDDTLWSLTSKAHGNPFLVHELLRGLREENRIVVEASRATAVGAELPQRLTENMEQRLQRLCEEARHMVQVASILPVTFSVSLLTKMLDLSPARLLASVGEAVRADLLAEDGELLRFRHDLLRQAARQSIPYALRRALERQSAHILLEQGADPAEVAAQLARSADIGDVEAVTALRNAAVSLVTSDPSGAADLSLRAIDLLPPDDEQHPVLIAETVELLNRARRYQEAQQLGTSTMSTDIPEEAEGLIRLTMSSVIEGYASTRVEQNRRALQLRDLTDATRARHLAYLAHGLVFEGLPRDATEAAEVAMEAANRANDLYARMLAEISLAIVDCSMGRASSSLERIYRVLGWAPEADEKISSLCFVHCVNLLRVLGRLDESQDLNDLALTVAHDAHHGEAIHIFTHLKAIGEFVAGRLVEARQLIDSLPEDQRWGVDNVNNNVGALTMAALAAQTEDLPLQRVLADEARIALGGGLAEQRAAVGMLAPIAWQRGDVEEASRWFGEDLDLLGTPPSAIYIDQIVIAARIVETSGDAGLRARVLTTISRLLHDDQPPPVFAGVASHAQGLLDRDLAALELAVETLSGTGRPLTHAGAMEDLGRLLHAHGRTEEAITALTNAFEVYGRCQSTADGRRVAKTLQRLGVNRRVVRPRQQTGWASLTASERRVVDCVLDGATNREVALRLSVSTNTVNTHLHNVFTKLGVHSRTELEKLVRNGGPDDAGAKTGYLRPSPGSAGPR